MLFSVGRTSRRATEKPCEEAVSQSYIDGSVEREAWFVEIGTLDELLGFLDKHGGQVVIWPWYEDDTVWQIEIYDGYRE